MGFRKLGGFEQLEALDLLRDGPGTQTQVTYLSMDQFQSQYNADRMATSYKVVYETEKRQFYGSTVLDRILKEAKAGDELIITYLGEVKSPDKGKRPFKNFEVVLVDENYEGDDRSNSEETKPTKKKPF